MDFTTRPELVGTFGMATSTHYLASQSAMAVLEAGGNAADAAVAGAFMLHIVEPHLNGPGGEVPIIIKRADGEPEVLCGQGVAPAGATIEHYTGLGLEVVPGSGLLAPAVPAAVVTWLTLLRDHGTMTPRAVLHYAIEYAADGHPLIAGAAAVINRHRDLFTEHWPTSAAAWLNTDGSAPTPQTRWRNPAWAATLQRLCEVAEAAGDDHGVQCDAAISAWADGFVAEAIERFVSTPVRDSTGRDHAGVMTAEDISSWRPTYERPTTGVWRGWEIFKCGPWSQGPVLLETLSILHGLIPDRLADWDAATIHACIEATKLAFADRDAYFGDSGDTPLQVGRLLHPAYIGHRASLVGDTASMELRPGQLGTSPPRLPAAVRAHSGEATVDGLGEPTSDRSPALMAGLDDSDRGDTCHIDVIDRTGMCISATPSGGWLQSSPYIPELGFCLGSRLQMTWLEEGLPSSLRPGRRPRTTLTPSMAVHSETGQTVCFGTPGGDQQDQWQLVFWLAHTVLGRNLQAAIDAPSWNSEAVINSFDPRVWRPGVVSIEGRVGEGIIGELRERGHLVAPMGDWALGRISAASHDPRTGLLRGAANPRGMQGYAVGR